MTLDCKLSLQPATKGHFWLLISNIFLNPLFLLPTFCHTSEHFSAAIPLFYFRKDNFHLRLRCVYHAAKGEFFWGRLLLEGLYLLPSETGSLIPYTYTCILTNHRSLLCKSGTPLCWFSATDPHICFLLYPSFPKAFWFYLYIGLYLPFLCL